MDSIFAQRFKFFYVVFIANLSEKEEHEEITRIYERANHNRRLAEDSALDYLLKSDFGDTIDKNTTFSRDHEIKLKHILDELKNEKLMIQSSIAEIEPFIPESDKNKNSKNTFKENSGLNIENIVFLQDFIDMKVIIDYKHHYNVYCIAVFDIFILMSGTKRKFKIAIAFI
jgi:hypothetical protein